MDDNRPNPELLLSSVEREEAQALSGRLTVFFGMCPGAGKTFAMLKAAQEQKSLGQDIVVGVVETHGRKETLALLTDFEIIPKKTINYKDSQLHEMDLDAILVRNPNIVLVDELAHTNAPGSRHAKRYQDVEELLRAGIHVYTTVNVQHIESRSDLVSQITGVHIRERVPDLLIQKAHQITLIDITPEELRKRLYEGKVYLGDRAANASENFFRVENLTALRELSLRFTAENVDYQLRDQMNLKNIVGPWNTNERLLVAISHSPYSARLIRAARRMAFNLEAPWIALYIDRGEALSDNDKNRLNKNITLAGELGAEVITSKETDIATAIRRICEERNVTQVIIGRPDRRFFRDILANGTILDQLVRETHKIDIHVVSQERKPKFLGFSLALPEFKTGFLSYWHVMWMLFAVSFASYAVLPWIGYRAVGFLFLLAVLMISSFGSTGPIVFAALSSSIIWNYFFIPPLYTISIKEPEDFMMCIAYFFVAIVAGYLAHKIRKQEEDLLEREFKSNTLYEFGKQIAAAKDNRLLAYVAQDTLRKIIPSNTLLLLAQDSQNLNPRSAQPLNVSVDDKTLAVAQWSFTNKQKAGWSTETLSSAPCLSLPLRGKQSVVGVVLLFPNQKLVLALDQKSFIENIVNHLAVSIERNILEQNAAESRLLKESEKLHQTLLNSVSHELRTPITSILGTASALADPLTFQKTSAREELLVGLVQSSQRLNQVVENLLDMSRISNGMLQIKKELFELNDFIDSFLQRNKGQFKNHNLVFKSTSDIFIEGDDKLLEHVLINLLHNAAAYSQPYSQIELHVELSGSTVDINVLDEGPGIDGSKLKHIFDAFYRIPGSPTGGTGLGLTICKSITEAHGGQIYAANRTDRSGAKLTVRLPIHLVQLNAEAEP